MILLVPGFTTSGAFLSMDTCHCSVCLCACLSPELGPSWGCLSAPMPPVLMPIFHQDPPFHQLEVIFTFLLGKPGQMTFLNRATFSASFPKQLAVDTFTLHGQKVQVIKRPLGTVVARNSKECGGYDAIIHFLNSFSFSHLTQVLSNGYFP